MKSRCFPVLIILLSLCIGIFISCSSDSVAGGVSEETNTIAGILVNSEGAAAENVPVVARLVSSDDVILCDTTDKKGAFGFAAKKQGTYGISADLDSLAFYQSVNFEGDTLSLKDTLKPLFSVVGTLSFREDSAGVNISLLVPGTDWTAETDSEGYFNFENLPVGNYLINAISPEPEQFLSSSFLISISDSGRVSAQGPVALNSNPEALIAEENDTEISDTEIDLLFPISTESGLKGWWSMNILANESGLTTLADLRGQGTAIVYGNATLDSNGVSGSALVFRDSSQFAVVEDCGGVLDSAMALTLEAWIYIDSLNEGTDSSYRKNLVGEVGYGTENDEDVFSLAVVKNACGETEASLSFFLADGSGMALDCENAVLDSVPVKLKTWIYAVAVWDGNSISLYRDGSLVARKNTNINMLNPSVEALYFGKGNLNFKLDNVRWSTMAVNAADVFYRYSLQGGF